MKKMKLIALTLLIVLCVSFLCSCDMLDELKAQRIIAQEDGTLLCDGQVYRILPKLNNSYVDCRFVENGFVVDEDVPLLLIQNFGRRAFIDPELNIIDYADEKYCLEADYDRYSEIIKNENLDRYKVDDWYYNYESDKSERVYHIFDEKEMEQINAILQSAVVKETTDWYDPNIEMLEIYRCDRTGLLRDDSPLTGIYRRFDGSSRGIVVYNEMKNVYQYFEISQEQRGFIDDIFEKYYDVQYMGSHYYRDTIQEYSYTYAETEMA